MLVAFSLKLEAVEKGKILDLVKGMKPEYKKGKTADATVEATEDNNYEMKDNEEELLATIKELQAELAKIKTPSESVMVSEFEKDDDTNHHIDFITACSNLRCRNYKIATAERHKVKLIAGKIIPALATTTAMITGLITIELLKHACGFDKLEQYRNSYCNLGISQVLNQVEPTPAKKREKRMDPATYTEVLPVPMGFTSWDKVTINGNAETTIKEFVEQLKEAHHGVKASLVYKHGITSTEIAEGAGQALWNGNPYLPGKLKESNAKIADQPLLGRYTEIYGEVAEKYVILDVDCEDNDGNDAE